MAAIANDRANAAMRTQIQIQNQNTIDQSVDQTPVPVPASNKPAQLWVQSPLFDLLFISNAFWPFFLLIAAVGTQITFVNQYFQSFDFWTTYLLITPHRWITLVLIMGDHERFQERRNLFLGLAVCATIAISVGAIGALTALAVIDFLWNAWHFAAQHGGIARIYGRMAGFNSPSNVFWEKVGIRAFCVYVFLRLGAPLMADDRSLWLGWLDFIVPYMKFTDLPMLAIPVCILAFDFYRMAVSGKWLPGRIVYITSVLTLYSATLLIAHYSHYREGASPYFAALLIALTVFHSTEYLAIVTWSVWKRYSKPGVGSGPMVNFSKQWVVFLAVFMLSLGLGAWMLDMQYKKEWFLINTLVSYLHYAYDGIIWKARPPAAAK